MRPLRLGVAAALAVCALTGISVLAQQNSPAASTTEKAPEKAVIDKPVAEFKLVDLAHQKKAGEKAGDDQIALSSFRDKKPVVLFFMSEQCSVTWRYEKRFGELIKKFGKDVAILGVRCSANDTPKSICKFADSKNFTVPVLNDEHGKLTSYFKVTNTPSFALIDKKGAFRYFGSFDDAPDEPEVTKRYLPDAITAVMGDKVVAVKMTRPFG
jgi:peroxiredoxin